jgi:hypothetical protein
MGENVVALRPEQRPVIPGKPDQAVIDLLESFLQDARSGKIVAIAIAGVLAENAGTSDGLTGAFGTRMQLGGAVLILQHKLGNALAND